MKSESTPQENQAQTELFRGAVNFIIYMLEERGLTPTERHANVQSYLTQLKLEYGKEVVTERILREIQSKLKELKRLDLLKMLEFDWVGESVSQCLNEESIDQLEKIKQAYEILFKKLTLPALTKYVVSGEAVLLDEVVLSINKYGHWETFKALEQLKNEWKDQADNLSQVVVLQALERQLELMKEGKNS